MTLAVHIPSGRDFNNLPDDHYLITLFTEMAIQRPEHHFLFLFDAPHPDTAGFPTNITPVLMGPAIRNRLIQHYWHQYKLPRLLHRYDARWYINSEGMAVVNTAVKQCLILEDLAWMDATTAISRKETRYQRKFFPVFAKKITVWATRNSSLPGTLTEKRPIDPGSIHPLPPFFIQSNNPLPQSTDDPYFCFLLTAQSAAQAIPVLKAFSIFKKWQKSSMPLHLISSLPESDWPALQLNHYKYREQIHCAGGLDEDQIIHRLSGSYANIHLPVSGRFSVENQWMARAGSALITTRCPYQEAVWNECALYASPSAEDIAEQMMRIYKDENLRASCLRSIKGLEHKYRVSDAARELLLALEDA